MHYPAGCSMRAHEQRDPGIPLRSYFLSVGAVLIGLLFAANWLLPSPPSNSRIGSEPNLPNIRIHSELKGPEAVVIDTTRAVPTQVAAAQMDVSGPQALGLDAPAAHEADAPRESGRPTSVASAALRASFAQLVGAPPKRAGASETKRRGPASPGRGGQ